MIRMKTNLNEYYFGGNDPLKEAEKALEGMKLTVQQKGITVDLALTKDYKILKEALCEVFGFQDMLLDLSLSGNVCEIFTMPAYLSATAIKNGLTGNKNVTTNKYGVCFTKESYTVPYIRFNAMTMISAGISPKEALAIILHEVGHNFFGNDKKVTVFKIFMHFRTCLVYIAQILMTKKVPPVQDLFMVFLAPFAISSTTIGLVNNIIGFIKTAPVLRNISMLHTAIVQLLSIVRAELIAPIALIMGLVYYPMMWTQQVATIGILSIFNLLTFGWLDTIYLSYDNEKFSDNFATSYGYGPDLMTGLVKLEKYMANGNSMTLNNIAINSKSEILPWVTTIVNYPMMIMSLALVDCHPTAEARIIDQGKMLRAELKRKDLKPETKKRILKDLDEMDKVRKDYFDANNKDGSQTAWRKLSSRERAQYGGDIREKINPTKDYDWASMQNAILRGKTSDKGTFKGL